MRTENIVLFRGPADLTFQSKWARICQRRKWQSRTVLGSWLGAGDRFRHRCNHPSEITKALTQDWKRG